MIAIATAALLRTADLSILADTPVLDRMPSNGQEHRIALLRAGTTLPVAACVDTKSLFGYEIRLADGRHGYVLPAETIRIAPRPAILPPYGKPIVWNCL